MTEEFYFDTSIWIDFYEARGKNGEFARKLIEKTICENLKILHSDHNICELRAVGYSQDEVDELLGIIKLQYTRKIRKSKRQVDEAKLVSRKRNVSRGDALHAILARDHNVQWIARDNDFAVLKDIAETKPPEHFINE